MSSYLSLLFHFILSLNVCLLVCLVYKIQAHLLLRFQHVQVYTWYMQLITAYTSQTLNLNWQTLVATVTIYSHCLLSAACILLLRRSWGVSLLTYKWCISFIFCPFHLQMSMQSYSLIRFLSVLPNLHKS